MNIGLENITYDRQKLEAICRQYHVRRLAVFGSRSRGDNRADSDLDLLVEFEVGKEPGYEFFRLERELSEVFHLKVDLNTRGFLSRYFRDEVVNSARAIYAD
jgi:predicted nucleotidyltransferase